MEKKSGGKPEHIPTSITRELVIAHTRVGTRQDIIASILGIKCCKTLRKHYREELDHATSEANAIVGGALFNKAVNDNDTAAQIFWLKTRAGFSEKNSLDLISSDGSMTPTLIEIVAPDYQSKD